MNKSLLATSKNLRNDEEENYEDLIQVFISQRHTFSASLPPPSLTDLLIDQITEEINQKKAEKELNKYQVKQSLLLLLNSEKNNSRFTETPASQVMIEIAEVTSSEEQSPIHNINLVSYNSDDDIAVDISQEIKPSEKKSIPKMLNKFFPVCEKFIRNKLRITKILTLCRDLNSKKDFKTKALKFIEENPNKIYAFVFSPVNKEKIGLFSIFNEKAIKIFGEDLPDLIPLSKINRKFTFDFQFSGFVENNQIIDGFDFNEELLS